MTAILFNPLLPIAWVVISAMLAFCLLAWLEVKRNQKLRTARLLALLLAVLSVVCLVINPSLSSGKSANIIVLTPGYSKKTLDSLVSKDPRSPVYKLHGVTGTNNALEIQHYRDLVDLKGNISLLGAGVPQYMLEYMDASSLRYFPGSMPEGFIGIRPDKVYTENQPGEVNGIIHASGYQTVTLTGPGGAEDSVRLHSKNPQPFSLTFTPKTSGLYVYTVSASDSSGKIRYSERVPIHVKEQKPLSILFLSDYPSAEVRFLKNFLENRRHKLTLRYKISKAKYRTEFINTPQKSVGRLNESLLQSFDLVLTDASSLASLTETEIRALKEGMKGGLGVITLIQASALSRQANDLLALTLANVKSDSAKLLVNKQFLKIPATAVSVSSEKKLVSIQRESSGRMVSGYYQSGLGKSGFQLLTHTFSLELAGEKEAYAQIWSPLIESVARKEIRKYDVRFITPFPHYPDEPVEFKIIAGGEKPTVKIDSSEIPLVEDPLIKKVWFGKIWAGPAGWNSLHIDQDSSQHKFFVSQPDAWKSLQVFNQQKSIRRLASQKAPIVEQVRFQPVSRIIFFILFLLAAGFLWFAPKL
jgi:hypothetical protein